MTNLSQIMSYPRSTQLSSINTFHVHHWFPVAADPTVKQSVKTGKKYYSKDKKMIKCQFDKILGLFMVLNLIKHNL